MNQSMNLMEFLHHRLAHPRGQLTFSIYFWTTVVGVGGAGVWAEVVPPLLHGTWVWDWPRLAAAFFTFFPAIAVTSGFDLALNPKQQRVVRAFGIGAIIAVMGWLLLCMFHPIAWVSAWLGLIGSIIALLLWRVANGENPLLHDSDGPTFTNPMGGPTERPAAGSEGDFKL